MRRLLLSLLCLVLAMAMLVAPAEADFGLSNPEVAFTEEDESPATLAGSHPFAMRTSFEVNTTIGPKGFITVDGALRDLHVTAPAGFVGDTTAAPQCDALDFIGKTCSPNTALGTFRAVLMGGLGITGEETVPIYNLNPSPGSATRYGFIVAALPIYLNVTIKPTYPFNVVASSVNVSQIVELLAADTILWGNPASPSHDKARGKCALSDTDHNGDTLDDDICPSTLDEQAYLTLPRSCTGPLSTDFEALAWWSGDPVAPDPIPATFSDTVQSDAMEDCAALGFAPEVRAAPTTNLASSPSGFEFGIEVDDPGLKDPTQRADSDLKKAVVTLPEGMTVNPAAGGGLSACSQAQLANETSDSDFGAGCPAASRVASVEVDTPLLKEHVSGSVFLAEPYSNPLGTLLAGYLVIKQPERGIVVKLPGRIDADPNTGQLTASFDQNPQFPFSSLQVSFFPGPRAALTTPDACGDYAIETELYPWSGNAPDVSTQPFTIAGAPGGGSCPASASGLPHAPSFDAGTASPIAKAYSPFLVNLRRPDGSQRFSTVSLTPPPGLVAKLAGTAICTEGALTAAQARSGKEEQAAPSCPAASRVGSVYAALGSGPDPYWAPGTAYLTGPYKGAPLSMAIVSPAVAGPFDLGVVVIRVALHLDPVSARITAVSDPIPPFLEGIPLDVRVASVRLDRPQFTLNGTSCDPEQITAQVTSTLGAVANLTNRFQLAECTRLAFKPQMKFFLKGGTKRGDHPSLTATLKARPGDANIAAVSVALPRSEFLDQAHIGTVCTRVQWATDTCPVASAYGTVNVKTQLFDFPLAGQVYLRSSDNELPDLVPDLRGPASQPIRIEAAGRTDSIRGGIRNTFDFVPDAPFAKLTVQLKGAKKGLLVNSRDVCARPYRATVRYRAHNGATYVDHPPLVAKCPKGAKGKRAGAGKRR